MALAITSLETIRQSFQRGSEQFPHLKVGITNIQEVMIEETMRLGVSASGWNPKHDSRELWHCYYFDERQLSPRELLPAEFCGRDYSPEPEAVLLFDKLKADAEHILNSIDSPMVRELESDGFRPDWLALLLKFARPSWDEWRERPVGSYAEFLLGDNPKSASKEEWGKAYERAENKLIERDGFISDLDAFSASVALVDLLIDGEAVPPNLTGDTESDGPPEELLDELTAKEAALLRHIWKRRKATFNALHNTVWKGKTVQDDAIRRTANRLKDKLELNSTWDHIQVAVKGEKVTLKRPDK